MPMTPEQTTWVGQVTGVAAQAQQADTDFEQRQAGAQMIAETLTDDALQELQDAFAAIQVELKNGKSMPLLDTAKHDPFAEVDTYADMPGAKPIDGDKLGRLQEQYQKILAMQAELEQLDYYKVPEPADPDFPTYEEAQAIKDAHDRMARDLWQPLMRQGIIPENMINDRHSEVVQTFQESSALYEARLQEHSKNMSKADIFLEKFAPVETIGKATINAAGKLTGFAGSVAAVTENAKVLTDTKEAAEVIEMCDVVFTATCKIVPTVVKERDAIKAVDIFNEALGTTLKSAGVDPTVADCVTGIINGAARSANAGKLIAEGDLEGAFNEFGKAITSSFAATGDKQLTEVGKLIGENVSRLATATGAAKALAEDPPKPGKAMDFILAEIGNAVGSPEVKAVIGILRTGAQELPDAIAKKDAFAVTDTLTKMLGQSLTTAGVDAKVATAITGTITAGARGAAAGKHLAEGNVEAAFKSFGDGIATGLAGTGNSDVAAIGEYIKTGLETAAQATAVKQAMAKTPPDTLAAMKAMEDAAASIIGSSGVKDAIKAIAAAENSEKLGEDLETARSKLEEATKLAQESTEEYGKIDGPDTAPISIEAINKLKEQKALEEAAAARSEEEKLRAFMEEKDAAFEELLVTGFPPPSSDAEEIAAAEQKRLDSMETLIAIVQRDKMTFQLAQKIVTKGPGLIADLVPGMGLVQACAELAFAIAEAVKHAEQLLIWIENVEDAGAAATVQLDAMMNRYGLETKQNIIADIKVGIKAVKVAGEATKLSPAAPIGLAISSGADAGEALLDLGVEIEKNVAIAQAWAAYKTALEQPQNRKAARMALRKNPTLSKYAMAYGAKVEGNAIAKEAMRRCGINERTLAQPETNVDKVVTYLEQLYDEDPVVVRAVGVANDWHPGEIELTYESFCRFHMKATSVAKPTVTGPDAGRIKSTLATYETAVPAFEQAVETAARTGTPPDETVERAAVEAVVALGKALKAYSPEAETGGLHQEMADYVHTLGAKTSLKHRALQKLIAEVVAPQRKLLETT